MSNATIALIDPRTLAAAGADSAAAALAALTPARTVFAGPSLRWRIRKALRVSFSR